MKPSKNTLIVGAVLMALAVITEAFGAHALKPILEANQRTNTFELAARYHIYHSLAILVFGLLETNKLLKISVFLMISGILCFSGSLYVLSVTGQKWLGAITPIGGFCFIFSWGLFAWNMLKKT
ncbi:MAG: DUF423 domain-containing protein [Flammeovirgaceae bacterium]